MRKTQDLSEAWYRTLMARMEPSLYKFIHDESFRQRKSIALLVAEVLTDFRVKIEKKSSE